ncbi:MAG: hypothetical protein F8N37_01220 [Telmatospirillum sp.]|nr:hypothetical protein [Telmatospirillum sp.]
MTDIETIVRDRLCRKLKLAPERATTLDLAEDLAHGFGLSSLDLITLMTSVCADAGVALTDFDVDDLARLKRPADIVALLAARVAA